MSDSLRPHGLEPPKLLCPWNSPGKNSGVGSHSFLQGMFLTQGLNPDVLRYRKILCPLSYQGSPRILKWVAYPFSRGSSPPGNWTRVSCIHCRRILYHLSYQGSPLSLINRVSFGETRWYLKANTRSESFSFPTTRRPCFIHPFISSTSHITWRKDFQYCFSVQLADFKPTVINIHSSIFFFDSYLYLVSSTRQRAKCWG